MSDSSLLQRYLTEKEPAQGHRAAHAEIGVTDDLNAFGWLRGVGDRAMMFEMRLRNGNIMAMSYNLLERIEFDPSEGIRLCFNNQLVQIKGRNLNAEVRPQVRLFDGILRHRVPWIQEADRSVHLQSNEQDTVITSVHFSNDFDRSI